MTKTIEQVRELLDVKRHNYSQMPQTNDYMRGIRSGSIDVIESLVEFIDSEEE